jgi:hypothetical protein
VRVLNLVEYACDVGVPVALAGQGLGPLDALPHDHLPAAADPAWLPTADEGATAGTDPPT